MVAVNSSRERSVCLGPFRRIRDYWLILAALQFVFGVSMARGQGMLQSMRDDVRSPAPAASADNEEHHGGDHHGHGDGDDDTFFAEVGVQLAFWTLTSPWWVPHSALGDDLAIESRFAKYPYAGVPGDMVGPDCVGSSLSQFKRWSGRLSGEYAGDRDDLSRIGGRFLLESSSRWGLDTEMSYLQENLPGGGHDQLWLGDCNVVFRFAQSEHMQWRTGLGFNWLDDPRQTDFGFNFTYGVDWFPRKPWVFSADVDWGNLGRAEQFRFRTTAGVLLWGIESYVGYEYYDLDSTQDNRLIGGVRIWF